MRPASLAIAQPPPTGPGYDVVLLLHVACVLTALVTVVVSGISAARLAAVPPDGRPGDALLRYYAPGVNWAGRAIYGVPVFGFALLAMSHGAFDLGDRWVLGGLLVWVLVAVGAEGILWPTEQRIRSLLVLPGQGAPPPGTPGGPGTAGGGAVGAARPQGIVTLTDEVLAEVRRLCRRAARSSAALVTAIVVGSVLMVVQP